MDDWTVRATPRRSWLLVVLLGVVAGLLVVGLTGGHPTTRRAGHAPGRATPTSAEDPIAVLRDWDRRRADAWAAGDRTLLRGLYATGSRAGRADLALLGRYLRRDLVVVGMRRQVLRARVLDAGPGRFRVRVTDRLVGAWAVVRDRPAQRARLPDSRPRTLVLDLRRTSGEWRVVAISPPPPAPPARPS